MWSIAGVMRRRSTIYRPVDDRGARRERMDGPTFLIVGAQKCGTTSLHHYLSLHPEISVAATKETDFFCAERSDEEYRRYARSLGAGVARGEASPSYSMHPAVAGVPERIQRRCPQVRLVYVLGDPVDRVARSVREAIATGGERRAPDRIVETIDGPDGAHYLVASLYARQLREYLRHFPLDRVQIVDQDELRERRSAVLAELFGFLGVDPAFRSDGFRHELNTSRDQRAWGRVEATRHGPAIERFRRLPVPVRRPLALAARRLLSTEVEPVELDERARALLAERIAPDTAELRRLTGRTFPRWSV